MLLSAGSVRTQMRNQKDIMKNAAMDAARSVRRQLLLQQRVEPVAETADEDDETK